jgi:hypothetical protein
MPGQSSTISKSSFRAPHSGQVQFIGTSSQHVPGAMPSSGSPAASSYMKPQIKHIQALDSLFSVMKLALPFQRNLVKAQ